MKKAAEQLAMRQHELFNLEFELQETENVQWWLRKKGYTVDPQMPNRAVSIREKIQQCRTEIKGLEGVAQDDY